MNFYYDSGHLVNPRTYYNLDEQLIFKDIDRPNRETLLIDGSSYYRVCPPDDYQSSEGLQKPGWKVSAGMKPVWVSRTLSIIRTAT